MLSGSENQEKSARTLKSNNPTRLVYLPKVCRDHLLVDSYFIFVMMEEYPILRQGSVALNRVWNATKPNIYRAILEAKINEISHF